MGLTSSDDLHRRLPLQVPPRSVVRPVVAAGAVRVVLDLVGLAVG